MPRQPNHYRVLDVALQADQDQIQHAYRTLAKRYHPDVVPRERREWARTQMARINAAYEVLGNPARRAAYDREQGYARPVRTDAAHPQSIAASGQDSHKDRITVRRERRRHATLRDAAWRHDRPRRERMTLQRLFVLSSAVTLGVILLGALVWWRLLSPGLPQHRWTWAILLAAGVGLIMVLLWRATR